MYNNDAYSDTEKECNNNTKLSLKPDNQSVKCDGYKYSG